MLETYDLTVSVESPQKDTPIVGAVVTAILDRVETDGGYVVQRKIESTTDSQGVATLSLWPNSRGSGDSRYVVYALDADGQGLFEVSLNMPARNCNLADEAGPPLGNIDPSASLVERLQRLRDETVAISNDLNLDITQATDAAQTATQAAADAGLSATQATDAATQADTVSQQAQTSALSAEDSAASASQSATQADSVSQQAQSSADAASSDASRAETAANDAAVLKSQVEDLRDQVQALIDNNEPSALVVSIADISAAVDSPVLVGTYAGQPETVTIALDGSAYPASFANGTWTVNGGVVGPLADGAYPIGVTAQATGQADATASATLTIDSTAPDPLTIDIADSTATVASPALSGTVGGEPDTVTLAVAGQSYGAAITGTTWTLAAGTLDALANGGYTVSATARKAGLADAVDTATLTIEVAGPLTLTLDTPAPTTDTTPTLTGTVSDAAADITVELTRIASELAVTVEELTTESTTPILTGTVSDPAATVTVDTTLVSEPEPEPEPGDISDVAFTATLDGETITATAPAGSRVRATKPDNSNSPVSIRHFSDGAVCIENMYLGLTGDADMAGIQLTRQSATPATIFSGDLNVYAYARTRPFWRTPPALRANPDMTRLPNYASGSENASRYNAYQNADNGPMGYGLMDPAMPGTGERDDIGLFPTWDACYMTNPTANNAEVVRGMSDASAVVGVHVLDPDTDALARTDDNPTISFHSNLVGGRDNPIVDYSSSNPTIPDWAHYPNLCTLASVIYDTEYDREEKEFVALYTGGIWDNDGYRVNGGAGPKQFGGAQTRGYAWGSIRDVAIAATNGGPNQDLFETWTTLFANSAESYLADHANDYPIMPRITRENGRAMAPWEQHYLSQALGYAVKRGVAAYAPMRDYFARFVTEAINTSPHELASIYDVAVRTSQAEGHVRYQTWLECLQGTAEYDSSIENALAAGENTPELIEALGHSLSGPSAYQVGDFSGYPWSPSGYSAILRAATAWCKAQGTANADEAWATVLQHNRSDFSDDPKNNFSASQ